MFNKIASRRAASAVAKQATRNFSTTRANRLFQGAVSLPTVTNEPMVRQDQIVNYNFKKFWIFLTLIARC